MRFLFLACLLFSCRSTTMKSSALMAPAPLVQEAPVAPALPLGIGEGYQCVLDKKSQAMCFDSKNKSWKTLRVANSAPTLRNLVARSTVACAIGVKPPALENRILCWQPESETEASISSPKMSNRMRTLSLQKDKVCVLFSDGQVGCGPLIGNGTPLKITNLQNLRTIRSLASGEAFTCALRETGAILCWGDSSKGQLGVGKRLAVDNEAVAIAGFSGSAVALATGARHVCAINESGEVFCWGDNGDQQLGVDSSGNLQNPEPQAVRGLPGKARVLALGDRHSCAQLNDGTIWCWGAAGRLGSGTTGGLIPARVRLPVASAQTVASLDTTCSQLTTGEIFCWGPEPEIFEIPQ